ncbi:hypothetical protein BsWGS_16402 [Bradybaena similaris]
MDNSTFQYFAYGSNMLTERIHINNPTAKLYGIGKLYGYRLAFDVPIGLPASNWHGASGTIRPAGPKEYVYGVIWNIQTEDLAYLDSQENHYTPMQVDVELDGGETVSCRSYEMHYETSRIPLPSPHYKRVIIAGAKQHGLPEDYIQYLECFPDNGLEVVPPNYMRVLEVVAKYKVGKEKSGQITPLDYNIERELMTLVRA